MTIRAGARTNPIRRPSAVDRCSSVLRVALLLVTTVIVLIPALWALDTSLKTQQDVLASPPKWLPSPWVWENYVSAWVTRALSDYFVNTVIVAVATTIITLAIAVHAAYAMTRFTFRGRGLGSFILLMSMMVPIVALIVPQFLLALKLSLVNTKTLLVIIDSAWQIPLAVWILRAHFLRVPAELDEAACLDGCSRLMAFYRVVIPVSLPGIAAASIVVFVWVWNEFIIGLTMTTGKSSEPIAPSMYNFITEGGIEWGAITAAAVIALAPVIVLFVALQRHFVQGLTAGAGK